MAAPRSTLPPVSSRRRPRARALSARALVALVLSVHALATAAAGSEAAALSAATDLPPVGRSLFDHLTAKQEGSRYVQRVPLPFDALLANLQRRVAPDVFGKPGVKAVLIPLGRSLQRNAAPGEHFDYPRVVAGVVGEALGVDGAPAMLLKDRLYLGYHEKAAILEVISYNEASGRFEFQVVKDYRPSGTPRVFYANRTVCLACHQNAAPIFSRPTWDETNANPLIAGQLAARRPVFYGVAVGRGVDEPNAIDDATERANLYSVAQTLWREGCAAVGALADPISCRAHAFLLALKYRLSGAQSVDAGAASHQDAFVAPLRKAWRARWPLGLAVPSPDVANRKPFAGTEASVEAIPDRAALLRAAEIRPAFDPLLPRAPLEAWRGEGALGIERFVKVLAEFIAAPEVRELDHTLASQWTRSTLDRRVVRAPCELDGRGSRIDLRCESAAGQARLKLVGRLDMRGARVSGGALERLELAEGHVLRGVTVLPAPLARQGAGRRVELALTREGLHARLPDGNAIERAVVSWDEATPRASLEVTVVEDFNIVAEAVENIATDSRAGQNDVFGMAPFRRAAALRELFTKLGMAPRAWCCEAPPAGMPAPLVDADRPAADRQVAEPLRPFLRHCAACHDSREASPPGFLHGDANTVARNLERCAERILFRLDMWQVAPQERAKTPMPPPYMWADSGAAEGAPPAADLARMREYAAGLIVARGQRKEMTADQREYESLAACRAGG